MPDRAPRIPKKAPKYLDWEIGWGGFVTKGSTRRLKDRIEQIRGRVKVSLPIRVIRMRWPYQLWIYNWQNRLIPMIFRDLRSPNGLRNSEANYHFVAFAKVIIKRVDGSEEILG